MHIFLTNWLDDGYKQKTPLMQGFWTMKQCGAERDRTADLLNAIQALSQLSYGPKVAYMQQLDATNAGEIKWHLYTRTKVFGTLQLPITEIEISKA